MSNGDWRRRLRLPGLLALALAALGGTASPARAYFPPFVLLPGARHTDSTPTPTAPPVATPPSVVTPPPEVQTPPEVVPPPNNNTSGGPVPPLPTQHMPEPATLLTGLIGSGLLGLYAARQRRLHAG